ncbi:MAG: hypothetical protein ACYTEO_14540 [Planctomycetota bacterium]
MTFAKSLRESKRQKAMLPKTGVRAMHKVVEKLRNLDYTSRRIIKLARRDIDFALLGLMVLNKTRPSKNWPAAKKVLLAHWLCTYSRYVHLNTWIFRISVNRVIMTVIPELMKSKLFVQRILKGGGLTKKQTAKLRRYKVNIFARIEDLRASYCCGLSPKYVLGVRDPKKSPSPSNIFEIAQTG